MTHRVLQQTTDSVLLDYNYNIETVIASDSLMKVNEQMLVLELILQCTDEIRRVTIEMNLMEASEFLQKLTQVESELLAASKSAAAKAEE